MNLPPPALSTAQDRKPIGNPTGASPDFGPQPGRTSPALGWSVIAVKPSGGGGRQGGATARLLMKNHRKGHQNIIFWGHCRSSKRLGRRFCRNRYFEKNKLLHKFSCNLRSKLTRSTLTSPGPIRVYNVLHGDWGNVFSSTLNPVFRFTSTAGLGVVFLKIPSNNVKTQRLNDITTNNKYVQ